MIAEKPEFIELKLMKLMKLKRNWIKIKSMSGQQNLNWMLGQKAKDVQKMNELIELNESWLNKRKSACVCVRDVCKVRKCACICDSDIVVHKNKTAISTVEIMTAMKYSTFDSKLQDYLNKRYIKCVTNRLIVSK